MVKICVDNFERVVKSLLETGWMDGWMDGWMGGWMEGKAGLRIAYSNQKSYFYPAGFSFSTFNGV